ncbi:CRE-TTR-50 protein [Caenorhabditis remanei]|uniref:CRE-TTR-50 protein n=2 Tax=Caenorhabditis remanei TaxID=31234 RepID=E3M7X5_CAERE|nr:CRE-TTR-50 protein [Caenorhabditis remanei]
MKSIVFFALFSLAAAQFGGYGRGRGGPGGQGGPGGFERGPGGFEGNTQGNELTYEAKGRLICGLTGVDKVRVVLWDRFRGRENIVYDETYTDVVGNFRLRATRNGFDGNLIQPFLTIYHDCDDAATPGLRKMTVQLPPQYTNQGSLVLKSFDVGTWNLETSFAGEELEIQGGGLGGRPIGGAFQEGNRGQFGGNREIYAHGGRTDFGESSITV